MPKQIIFTVPGTPKGKGRARSSARIGRDPRTGGPRVFTRHYTPEETAAYESLVKLAAAKAMSGREPYTGPIRMDLDIVLPIPSSWSGVRQRRAAAGEIAPTVKPDSDNVEKAVKDGIYGLTPRVTVVVTVLDMEAAQGVKKHAT